MACPFRSLGRAARLAPILPPALQPWLRTPPGARPFTQSSINLKKKKRIAFVPPLDEADLVEQFVRGSGPGGQAVNKTNNAVSLIHQPTGIRVQAHTHRSREANRNQARRVLAERVDYFLNRGQSQIEKAWKREQLRKLAKLRKRKKKEAEEARKKLRAGAEENVVSLDQGRVGRTVGVHRSNQTSRNAPSVERGRRTTSRKTTDKNNPKPRPKIPS